VERRDAADALLDVEERARLQVPDPELVAAGRDEDGRPRTRARAGGSGEKTHQQNQQLYAEEGMYNPKAAKAAKKRRKAAALDAPYSFDDAEWQEGGQADGAVSSEEESEDSEDSEMASESSD